MILLIAIPIKMSYIPWVTLIIDYAFGNNIADDIVIIIIGHIIYWLEDVFPMYYHWKPIAPPKFLCDIFFPEIKLDEHQNDQNGENGGNDGNGQNAEEALFEDEHEE